MTDKPSRNEDEYFAKLEAERLKKRREETAREAQLAERQKHSMKCPRCGADLVTEDYQGIQIDRCPECNGMWLDEGEVNQLVAKEGGGAAGLFSAIVAGVRRRGTSGKKSG